MTRVAEHGPECACQRCRGFEPGNQLAVGNTARLKHGAFSARVVDPLARELAEIAVDQSEHLRAPAFEAAVWAWARAEARALVLSKWIDEHGALDDAGVPRPALAALLDFERLAASARQRLGLDPMARARLGLDLARTPAAAATALREYLAGDRVRLEGGGGDA